eukprot:CAMPEP_0119033838 /NCGR_PEP_ID=MMETSP1177-20130426/905_1 /TAXON_ID=2985 /ORGANISM="Ochromonas sp, Strain CCMP1899" /LENGTH=399 /DNA_ID=CAMNT_0006990901 /DNA_START=122 /DNA_END=1321 /DNA_ORIENTATION=-
METSQTENIPTAPAVVKNIGRSNVRRVTPKLKTRNVIPDEILLNSELNEAISILPSNYNFEIHKIIWRIRSDKAIERVSLQFPEGLLLYSCIISDIIQRFGGARVMILGDVTYGACCVDDFTAAKLGTNLLVHFGHSCLVPITASIIKVIYVFVEIRFDPSHLVVCLKKAFKADSKLLLMGTIQFTGVLGAVHQLLLAEGYGKTIIPQAKPLSAGETLGCTSPILPECDALIFVADGRFHLEAAMIRNPTVAAYRYDPYGKVLTAEAYDVDTMKKIRWDAIEVAKKATTFGLILGTLGRQGSNHIFNRLRKILGENNKIVVPFLMAEINRTKLPMIAEIDVWVQVACPRLSIDWGEGFDKPILTPYELEVAMNETQWQTVYPMDYYSNDGGSWSNMAHR